MHKVQLIAHRGESHDAPENTLSAVSLAWERGATVVEVDVHATADHKICVIHDRSALRTTGKDLLVRKSTLTELQKLDAGSWKGEKWAGEKIPALEEVLETVPVHGKLVVEIKSGPGILDRLRIVLEESGLRNEQIEIIAFDLMTLAEAKRLMPQRRMFWVIESGPLWRQYATGMHPKAVITKLGELGMDGIAIGDSRHLTKKYVQEFVAAGMPVYVWTVNDPVRAAELLEYGVDGITSDRTAWMKEALEEKMAQMGTNKKNLQKK